MGNTKATNTVREEKDKILFEDEQENDRQLRDCC